jgi:hypothetical protein
MVVNQVITEGAPLCGVMCVIADGVIMMDQAVKGGEGMAYTKPHVFCQRLDLLLGLRSSQKTGFIPPVVGF